MRVSTAEFLSRVNDLTDRAETKPVTITDGGRDRLVLVSADEYARLIGRNEGVLAAGATVQRDDTDRVELRGEMPELWGALRHTVVCIGHDIAVPTGGVWDAER